MHDDQHEKSVRERAYALYLARGGKGGSAKEDWLRAEQELADTVRTAKPTFAGPPKSASKSASKSAAGIKEASSAVPENGRRHH